MISSRKRLRSDDSPFSIQTKVYVNQQKADSNDEDKMKQIYEKTRDLLYLGAKAKNKPKEPPLKDLVTLNGNGNVVFAPDTKPEQFEKKKSKCCAKDALIHSKCINCNLNECEYCAYSCSGCRTFVCRNCIMVFGCGTVDNPQCEACSMFG